MLPLCQSSVRLSLKTFLFAEWDQSTVWALSLSLNCAKNPLTFLLKPLYDLQSHFTYGGFGILSVDLSFWPCNRSEWSPTISQTTNHSLIFLISKTFLFACDCHSQCVLCCPFLLPKTLWIHSSCGVNGSVTLGDGLTQRGRYPGGRKSPSGVQGQRPNKGSSGRTPQADTYFGNRCKTDILRRKNRKCIDQTYMSRCCLKRTHAAVLLIHDNRHT